MQIIASMYSSRFTSARILVIGERQTNPGLPYIVQHSQHLTHVDKGLWPVVCQETLTKGSRL